VEEGGRAIAHWTVSGEEERNIIFNGQHLVQLQFEAENNDANPGEIAVKNIQIFDDSGLSGKPLC
jgi:hypothetical protein